jgi:hypothetical protein
MKNVIKEFYKNELPLVIRAYFLGESLAQDLPLPVGRLAVLR